jgi:hypothetical protein
VLPERRRGKPTVHHNKKPKEKLMSNRRGSFGQKLGRKAKREAKGIARGIAREGKKIATGAIKGFINVFNPFR